MNYGRQGRGFVIDLDRSRWDAHDREATRQQAINAATRCLIAGTWAHYRGDDAAATRYEGYIRDLVPVIVLREAT